MVVLATIELLRNQRYLNRPDRAAVAVIHCMVFCVVLADRDAGHC